MARKQQQPTIVLKAFQYTYTWVDGYPYSCGWDSVHAETVSKAKGKVFRSSEWDDFKGFMNTIRIRRHKLHDLVENEVHPLAAQLSPDQIGKMKHTIGEDYYGQNNDGEPYRNRYVIENDDDFEYLITLGLAEKSNRLNLNYYWLTDLGIDVIRSLVPIPRWAWQDKQLQSVEA